MTREEIENIPKNVNTLLGLSVTMHTRQKLDEKLNKVCELAIKALEQEPTKEEKALLQKWRDNRGISIEEFEEAMNVLQESKTDGDCISRDYLLSIAQQDDTYGYVSEYDIVNAPPVTPQEPKTGHWITTRTLLHDGEYYCDRCNCDSPKNKKWDYCPNCGSYNGGGNE